MAGKLKLSMMIGDYEIVRALKTARSSPGDRAPRRELSRHARHSRQGRGRRGLRHQRVHGGAYVVQKHRGREDFIALPVSLHPSLPSRLYLYHNRRGSPGGGLIGRRVACRTLGAAANYWMAGTWRKITKSAPVYHLGDRKRRRRIPDRLRRT